MGTHPDIIDLIRNYKKQAPRQHAQTPAWDLQLVLESLQQEPYEPLHKASRKFLTMKTVFLLALATGHRVSELHALIRRGLEQPDKNDWSSVTLLVDPQFIAKTAISSEALQSVTIPALTPLLSAELQDERTLCPVRALKFYLAETDKTRGTKQKLFISMNDGYNEEIEKQTLSRWIRDTVRFAYRIKDQPEPVDIRAHDTRKISSSWSVYNQVSMDNILAACTWKHKTTFVTHYMKNMSRYSEGLYKLGPLVVTQTVVAPPVSTNKYKQNKSSNGRDRMERRTHPPPRLPTSTSDGKKKKQADKQSRDKQETDQGPRGKPRREETEPQQQQPPPKP